MKTILSFIVAAAVLTPALGRADCVDGTRPLTPAEQEFGRRLGESLRAALPAAPTPLWMEREPQLILNSSACKDTPVGSISAQALGSYIASMSYSDRVQVTLRANFDYPGKDDLVLGSVPKKAAGLSVYNLVVTVDGYNKEYIEAVKQALDRARLQSLIDQPLPAEPAPAAWRVGNAQAAAAAPAASPAGGSPADTSAPAAEPDAAPSDVTQKAKESVKKLRDLLGR